MSMTILNSRFAASFQGIVEHMTIAAESHRNESTQWSSKGALGIPGPGLHLLGRRQVAD